MDFGHLRKRDLNQKLRKIRNRKERIKVRRAVDWLMIEESARFLGEIPDIEFVKYIFGRYDCRQYAIGDAQRKEVVPGIIGHDGIPRAGDTIIYGHGLKYPKHIGVWQTDGRVLSKWGDHGPVMLHRWDQVILDFGKYAWFSTYQGLESASMNR